MGMTDTELIEKLVAIKEFLEELNEGLVDYVESSQMYWDASEALKSIKEIIETVSKD